MRIFKYTLATHAASPDDTVTLPLPKLHRVLSVQMQGGALVLWALVHPDAEPMERRFHIVGTGHPAERAALWDFVATVQVPEVGLVWHVFAEGRDE